VTSGEAWPDEERGSLWLGKIDTEFVKNHANDVAI
jgi:hypothetical protein